MRDDDEEKQGGIGGVTRLLDVLHRAGVPKDRLAVLHGDGVGVALPLLRDPRVDFTSFTGSTRVGRIVKIWSSPVISKVLAMLRSVLTIVRTPSRVRRRLTAPISTPRAVESRNEVSVRSTTIRVRPPSTAAARADLSSGAVKRSISPATAMTWR